MAAETVALEGGERRAGGDFQRLAALGERRRHSLRGLLVTRRQALHPELREQRLDDRHAAERSRLGQRRQGNPPAGGARRPPGPGGASLARSPPLAPSSSRRSFGPSSSAIP